MSSELDDVTSIPSSVITIPTPIENAALSTEELALLEKTKRAASEQLNQCLALDGPSLTDIEPIFTDSNSSASEVASAAYLVLCPNFPNLAAGIFDLALAKEQHYQNELEGHAEVARNIQATMSQLIDLSGKFALYTGDEKMVEISAEVKQLCKDLKEKGIEILQGEENKVNRDRLAELKALISSHIRRLETDLKIEFSTKIQVKINELNSLLECLKTIEKYSSRLNSTIVSNQKGR